MHRLKIRTEQIDLFADVAMQQRLRPTRVYLDDNEICCRSLKLEMGVDRVSTVTIEVFCDDVDVEVNVDEERT